MSLYGKAWERGRERREEVKRLLMGTWGSFELKDFATPDDARAAARVISARLTAAIDAWEEAEAEMKRTPE